MVLGVDYEKVSGSKVKSGTLEIGATSTEYEIDTGLGNNLKRFLGILRLATSDNPPYVGLYGYDIENSCVAGCSVYSSGGYGKNGYNSSSPQLYNGIVSVSNGIVKITTASDTRYAGVGNTLYWYAE